MPGSSLDSIAPKEANEHTSNAQFEHAFQRSPATWQCDCSGRQYASRSGGAFAQHAYNRIRVSGSQKGHVGSTGGRKKNFSVHALGTINAFGVTTAANVKCADDNNDEWRC